VLKIFKDFDNVKLTDFFSLCQVLDSELLMNGIVCLRQYCTVVHYRLLRSDLNVMIKLHELLSSCEPPFEVACRVVN